MENQEILDTFEVRQKSEMAGFGIRVGASLIDSIILIVIISMIGGVLGAFIINSDPSEFSEVAMLSAVGIIYLGIPLLNILYSSLFESSKYQGTPGKMACKIKVVNNRGQKISFLQALGRNMGKFLSGLILWIGYLMIIWHDKKQGLHDTMANTYVIKTQ